MFTLQLAIRRLLHSPAFSLAVVLNFAMTAALFVAVLSIVDRVLLRPLPYAHADRLVMLSSSWGAGESMTGGLSLGDDTLRRAFTVAIRERARSIEDLAVATGGQFGDGGIAGFGDRPVPGFGDRPVSFRPVTYNLLRTVGVAPIVGRDFTEADAKTRNVVIISDELWASRFGRSHDVIDRTGSGPTIIGVLPPGFMLPSSNPNETFDGLTVDHDRLTGSSPPLMAMAAPVARLKAGVSVAAAEAEVQMILDATRLADRALADDAKGAIARVEPLHVGLFRTMRPYATLTLVAVSLVLLLGVANIATLVGIRWRSRRTEHAIQIALGASRPNVLLLPVVESALLSTAGVAIAVAVCVVFRGAIIALVPGSLKLLSVPPFDARMLIAAAIVTAACVLVAVIGVWLQLRRTDTFALLRDSGEPVRTARRPVARHAAVIVHLALSIGLIASALLTARSFSQLQWSRGFDHAGLVTVTTRAAASLESREGRRAVLEVISQAPEVEMVAAASWMPFFRTTYEQHVWKPKGIKGGVWGITPGFFETLRIPLLAGRHFTASEFTGRAGAAILNERGARTLFPDRPPMDTVGLKFDTAHGRRFVVGLVRDVKPDQQLSAEPGVFVPIDDPITPQTSPSGVTRMASTYAIARIRAGDGLNAIALKRAIDQRFGTDEFLFTYQVSRRILPRLDHLRFLTALLAALAIGALLVAATGIYAATAAALAFRRTEFAIRVALGATVRHLIAMLLRSEVRGSIVGIAAGVGLSIWLGRMLEAYLTGVEVDSATTYVVVGALLGSVALAAICGPVVRVVKRTSGLLDAMRHP